MWPAMDHRVFRPKGHWAVIISKLDWAKNSHFQQQLRDAKNLVSTGCDDVYIERWTKELGLISLWQETKS
jgi:hypothetical protein